ncbi:hypothetical protein CAPTEDRAFT_33227, partial [Capitella teleta]
HTLVVEGVNYTVEEKIGSWWKGCCFRPTRTKQVLKDITAHFKSQQLTGILGNSGSGKSSLLDLIAGRIKDSRRVHGTLELDGEPLVGRTFQSKAGYVIQMDRLLANLTVYETLIFSALLQAANEGHFNRAEVKWVMSDLSLTHVQNVLIGGAIVRGISGGERRRVSIAVQLLQDPDLLLLDEPTTGLDSFTAHHLVSTLNNLAEKRNKIIVMSIHQPRSDIFSLFDQIGILSQGEMIYFGSRELMVPYFTDIDFPCPTYANPLDYFVDIASIDRRTNKRELESCERLTQLREQYLHSTVFASTTNHIAVAKTSNSEFSSHKNANNKKTSLTTKESFLRFFWLLRILLTYDLKDKSGFNFFMRIMNLPLFAVFILIFTGKLNKNYDTAIQDRTGVIYQSISVPPMCGVLQAITYFPSMRNLYFRESREGQYSSQNLLSAYFTLITPFTVIQALVYTCMVYWGCGLYPSGERFAVFWGVVIAQQLLGEILTMACLGVFHSPPLAQATATISISIFLLIGSGFLRSQDNLPDFLNWMSYALNFKWSSEILNANEFHNLKFDC